MLSYFWAWLDCTLCFKLHPTCYGLRVVDSKKSSESIEVAVIELEYENNKITVMSVYGHQAGN